MHISRLERLLGSTDSVGRDSVHLYFLQAVFHFRVPLSPFVLWPTSLCLWLHLQHTAEGKWAANTVRTSRGLLSIVGPACFQVLLIHGPGGPSVTRMDNRGTVRDQQSSIKLKVQRSQRQAVSLRRLVSPPPSPALPPPQSTAYQIVAEWGMTGGSRLSVSFTSSSLRIIPSRCLKHPGCEWGAGNRSVRFYSLLGNVWGLAVKRGQLLRRGWTQPKVREYAHGTF